MKIGVHIPTNTPDSHCYLLPENFTVPVDTPVRFNFQGEPIGRVVSNDGDHYTMEVDESKFPLNEKKLKRLFPGGVMKEDGTFEIRECSITSFSFTDEE